MQSKKMLKVYVAGPITMGPYEINIHRGIKAGNILLKLGFAPFIPQLSSLHAIVVGEHGPTWDEWLRYDYEWIRSCDALYRLHGKSRGAAREVRFAKKLGIPVFYERKGGFKKLIKWSQKRKGLHRKGIQSFL